MENVILSVDNSTSSPGYLIGTQDCDVLYTMGFTPNKKLAYENETSSIICTKTFSKNYFLRYQQILEELEKVLKNNEWTVNILCFEDYAFGAIGEIQDKYY